MNTETVFHGVLDGVTLDLSKSAPEYLICTCPLSALCGIPSLLVREGVAAAVGSRAEISMLLIDTLLAQVEEVS